MEKNLRVLEFSGKDEDWKLFSRKFLSKAMIEGYKDLLLGKVAVPDSETEIDLNTDAGRILDNNRKKMKRLSVA